MPNMDGTGPRWNAPRGYGRGMGMCGRGFGPGYAANGFYGRGLGLCWFVPADNRETLTTYKTALEERLAEVNKQLESI